MLGRCPSFILTPPPFPFPDEWLLVVALVTPRSLNQQNVVACNSIRCVLFSFLTTLYLVFWSSATAVRDPAAGPDRGSGSHSDVPMWDQGEPSACRVLAERRQPGTLKSSLPISWVCNYWHFPIRRESPCLLIITQIIMMAFFSLNKYCKL